MLFVDLLSLCLFLFIVFRICYLHHCYNLQYCRTERPACRLRSESAAKRHIKIWGTRPPPPPPPPHPPQQEEILLFLLSPAFAASSVVPCVELLTVTLRVQSRHRPRSPRRLCRRRLLSTTMRRRRVVLMMSFFLLPLSPVSR